jgi:hypothetical protein
MPKKKKKTYQQKIKKKYQKKNTKGILKILKQIT